MMLSYKNAYIFILSVKKLLFKTLIHFFLQKSNIVFNKNNKYNFWNAHC